MFQHTAVMMRPGVGDEKQELQDLNRRLEDYLARVRQLEQENGALQQEIGRLRSSRDQGWLRGYREEAQKLRNRLQELRADKSRAELQLHELAQELQLLQGLCGEARTLRAQLDAQLHGYRRDLQQAQEQEAALQELLLRLQAERAYLQEEQERNVQELRELLVLPLPAAAGGFSLQEVQDSALLLISQVWEETCLQYQQSIQELEEKAKADWENQEQAAKEKGLCLQQLRKLERELQELQGLRQRLQEELLAMQEGYRLQMQEYQVMIESLEEEKLSLDMSVTDRLKDYNKLMEVKSGLSLEVAAYRALLEGESDREQIMWIELRGKKVPAGIRTFASEHKAEFSAHRRENDKRTFPYIRSNVNARSKGHTANISSSVSSLNLASHPRPATTDTGRVLWKDVPSSGYRTPVIVKEESSYESTARTDTGFRTRAPRYDFSKNTEIQQKIDPERRQREITIPTSFPVVKESTIHIRTLDRDQGGDLKLGTLQDTRSKMDHLNTFPGYELKSDIIGKRYQQIEEKGYAVTNQKAEEGKADSVDGKTLLSEKIREGKAMENERETTLEEKTTIRKEFPREKRRYAFEIGTEAALAREKPKKEERPVKQTELFIWEETNAEDKPSRKEKNVTLKGQGLENEAAGQMYVVPEEQMNERKSFKDKESFAVNEKSQNMAGYEIPITVGKHVQGQVSEGTLHSRASRGLDSDEETTKPTEATEIHDEGTETKGSEKETSWKETLAGNVGVADIFKHFGQPDSWETTEGAQVTYVERTEHAADGTVKTEITVQSAMEDDTDLTDTADLEALLNKNIKRMIPEDLKGTAAEGLIENIIHSGLKGKQDLGKKSVNVEIVEELLGSAMDEKSEFSTPFHVEEVDDSSTDLDGTYGGHGTGEALTAEERRNKVQPHGQMANVEEVTEEEDTGEELNYIVSTPDDYPLVHDQDDGSLYGQIHIEEESTIKYSWQDEFSQSTQSKRTVSGLHEYGGSGQSEIASQSTEGNAREYRLRQEQPKEETAHMEAVVTEKEIKIPHDFQTSLKEILSQETKDPKHQLKDALDQLQGSLPESIREELSALTGSGQAESDNMAVDIKKVEQTTDSGVVTIVAEINISQMLDKDNFDAMRHTEGRMSDMASLQSEQDDISENLKTESTVNGDINIQIDTSLSNNQSRPYTGQEFYSSSTLKGNDGVECYTAEQVTHFPASEAECGSTGDSPWSETSDCKRLVRHIKVGPTTEEIIFEGPTSEVLDAVVAGDLPPAEGFTDVRRSMNRIKVGPKEIHTTEEIIFEGPISKSLEMGGNADLSQTEDSSDARTSVSRISIGPTLIHITEQIMFEGPISEMSECSDREGSTDVNRSIRHVKLGSREIQTTERIVFEGPISENVEKCDRGGKSETEAIVNSNSSTAHFKLSPQESQTTEHIIFKGPISKTQEFSVIETRPEADLSTDIDRATSHIKLGSKQIHTHQQFVYGGPISTHLQLSGTENLQQTGDLSDHLQLSPKDIESNKENIFEEPVSEKLGSHDTEDLLQSEESTDINRSIRHIKLNAKEFHSPEVIFEVPVSKILESSDTDDRSLSSESADTNRSIEHTKLGEKELQSSEIIFEEPIFETLGSRDKGDHSVSEDSTNINRFMRHIKLDTTDCHSPEIIFEGSISEILKTNEKGTHSQPEGTTDINRSIKHIKLGPEDFQSSEIIFERPVSELLGSSETGDHFQCEKSTDNRSSHHFKVSPEEFHSSEIIFEGPVSETLGSSAIDEFSQLDECTDVNRSVKHIKLGPNEKSFTFHMDITQLTTVPSDAAGVQEHSMVFSSRKSAKEPEVSWIQNVSEDNQKDDERENGKEEKISASSDSHGENIQAYGQQIIDMSPFDKTLQLQRMVDQRSVISDEKKIAIIYLDNESDS
ncbi:synemin [Microcaecilia unicolor]|uniref:Synemin n=1 Tax=Microcaecilia unicolor TaxID=1415580 RepID=A0A6P7WWS2_9AMPH|nr:synemin [Microcaecilia unicolor]